MSELDAIEISVCPEEPNFAHSGKCMITTCQFHTTSTPTGCLSRDRLESSTKNISDLELYHFKCKENEDLGKLSVKQVGTVRRKQVSQIRNIISLYSFVRFIEDTCDAQEGMTYYEGKSDSIDAALNTFPLNHPLIAFKPWMFPHIIDEDLFREFLDNDRKSLPADINLRNMLCTTPVKYKALMNDIDFMSNPKNLKRLNKALEIRKQ